MSGFPHTMLCVGSYHILEGVALMKRCPQIAHEVPHAATVSLTVDSNKTYFFNNLWWSTQNSMAQKIGKSLNGHTATHMRPPESKIEPLYPSLCIQMRIFIMLTVYLAYWGQQKVTKVERKNAVFYHRKGAEYEVHGSAKNTHNLQQKHN